MKALIHALKKCKGIINKLEHSLHYEVFRNTVWVTVFHSVNGITSYLIMEQFCGYSIPPLSVAARPHPPSSLITL